MKLFSKTFLFCFFVVLSLEFLDSILAAKFRRNGNALNDSVILNGDFQKQDIRSSDAMISDGSVQATQSGEHVVLLSGEGSINLTMTYNVLEYEVCKEYCRGISTICYEASDGLNDRTAVGSCSDSKSCEFKVHGKSGSIYFGNRQVLDRDSTLPCFSTKMAYPYAQVLTSFTFESCTPEINNKVIKLYVNIKSTCSITVKNAKIHAPPTTSTSTKVPPPNKSPPNDSAEASSFPDWGYIILAIAALVVVAGIIGCIAFYFYKRRQSSKRASQKPDETIPKATVSKADVAVNVETPTKKNYDLEAAKVEPIQIPKKDKKKTTETLEAAKVEPIQKPKKDKKTKTQEPTTTEEIPAPTVEQQEPPTQMPKKNQKKTKTTEDVPAPTVSKQEPPAPASKEPAPTEQPPPNPTERPPPAARGYPVVKRLIPRGMKSSKTDSLDETLKIDKTAMVESFVDAAENHCLKSDESDILREMKAAYPKNVQHDIMPSEVDLLCLPVSKMFEEMDSMARDSQQKLADAGCEFAERHCIVSVSPEARRLLKDAKTDATTVCFAFGAEFYEYITDDPEIMEKASIPLLYAIALQPRFPEASRRKACAIMRRKLVRVLGYFKAADRAKMPFPVNIVENAYCKDPKYFYEPSGIKTYSGSDGKKKQIAVGKRKKKSSKKR